MKNIEVSKIIDPIPASDGAGVKLKRSIGVEPNYFDPFLMLDEFGSENSEDYIAGFPPHPHRGIETVTYMLAGDFEHEDSTGGKGRMTAGDVQWMRTGSGIIHSEMPAMKGIPSVHPASGSRQNPGSVRSPVYGDRSCVRCPISVDPSESRKYCAEPNKARQLPNSRRSERFGY